MLGIPEVRRRDGSITACARRGSDFRTAISPGPLLLLRNHEIEIVERQQEARTDRPPPPTWPQTGQGGKKRIKKKREKQREEVKYKMEPQTKDLDAMEGIPTKENDMRSTPLDSTNGSPHLKAQI